MSKRTIISAMEAYDAPIADSTTDQQDMAMTYLSDSKDDIEQIKDLSTAIEEAIHGVNTLVDIRNVMHSSLAQEGINQVAAELSMISIEDICNKLGFKTSYQPIPAVECFDRDNIVATRLAVEGLSDTISKIWNSIKTGFSNMVNKIIDFIDELSNNTKSLQTKLTTIEHELDKLSSKGSKRSDTINNKILATAFNYNSKSSYYTGSRILHNTKVTVDAAPKIAEALKDFMLFTAEWLEMAKRTGDQQEFDKNAKKHATKFSNIFDLTMKSVQTKDVEFNDKFGEIYGPYIDNRFLAIANLTADDISLGRTHPRMLTTPSATTTLEAMDLGEMKKFNKEIKDLLNSFSHWSEVSATLKKSSAAAEGIAFTSMGSVPGMSTDHWIFKRFAFINVFVKICCFDMAELSYSTVKHSIEYLMASISNWDNNVK